MKDPINPAARETDRSARAALSWLAEPGNRAMWGMVQEYGAAATLARLLRGRVDDDVLHLIVETRLGGFGRARKVDLQKILDLILRRTKRLGARIVVPSDDEWPRRMGELAALDLKDTNWTDHLPPLCLWVRGNLPLGETLERSVAVIGARAGTPYGIQLSSEIAHGLARKGWTVVSGGAFGVDAAAHRGALVAGGTTVAVLPSGVDRPYPAGNTDLFDQIAHSGLLVSEWPPGSEPSRKRFQLRGQVIAVVTAGTVLTESARRSGSIQMIEWAIKLGRPAMVVPGPVTSAMSAGSHELLRTKPDAILVTGLHDILATLDESDTDDAELPRRADSVTRKQIGLAPPPAITPDPSPSAGATADPAPADQ